MRAGLAHRNAVADEIVQSLARSIPVEEMRGKRGYRTATGSFEIRIKPMQDAPAKPSIVFLNELLAMNADRLQVSDVRLNDLSPNSGRYGSVSLNHRACVFDVVFAEGANLGEKFEKTMLRKLKNHVRAIKHDDQAEALLRAIQRADPEFDINAVIDAKPRSGPTKRSGSSIGESGKIIGDIVLEMIDGSDVYLSIKNLTGYTLANLGGVGAAFDPTSYEIDPDNPFWDILDDAGFDHRQISAGLRAYRDKKEPGFKTVESTNRRLDSLAPLYQMLKFAWGDGYFYVRQLRDGFKAIKVDEDFTRDHALRNLRVTELRYPGLTKQITAKIEGDGVAYDLEIRNSRSGQLKPNEAKIRVMRLKRLGD